MADPIVLSACPGDCTLLALDIAMPTAQGSTLTVINTGGSPMAAAGLSAYQILSAPIDLKSPEHLRESGPTAALPSQLPRVLLPLKIKDLSVDLSTVHDPAQPDRAAGLMTRPILVLLKFKLAPASPQAVDCLIKLTTADRPVQVVPVHLRVLSAPPASMSPLVFTARLDWSALSQQYPLLTEGVTPRLLNRRDKARQPLIHLLDQLMTLAHDQGASIFVPELAPTVKWPPGDMPQIDWTDFDSITLPWLKGTALTNRQPIEYWPLPEPSSLKVFDAESRNQYWAQATGHFHQIGFNGHDPIVIDTAAQQLQADDRALSESIAAREVLSSAPAAAAQVTVPADQLILNDNNNPQGIPDRALARLSVSTAGLVDPSPLRAWPSGAPQPQRWLPAGAVLPTGSVVTERSVRLLGWLAFLRGASVVSFDVPLADGTAVPAEDTPACRWFYPGEAFGVDHPLPTLDLLWLTLARQDYHCLAAARDADFARHVCQLAIHPLQLLPAQPDEPLDHILSGPLTVATLQQAKEILLEHPTEDARAARGSLPAAVDPLKGSIDSTSAQSSDLKAVRWINQHQQPAVLCSGVRWQWSDDVELASPGLWMQARLMVDLYNPSQEQPNGNQLQWIDLPGGWEAHPQPQQVPALPSFQLHRESVSARFNLTRAGPGPHELMLNFVDGFNGQRVPCPVVLPVAVSTRRVRPLKLDGNLADWDSADALQLDQPLVRLFNRTSLNTGGLQYASASTSIYSSWSDDNFYLAFRLAEVSTPNWNSIRNFVDYRAGRAWGEDLCEVLIQPLYADNSTGPTLHLLVKPMTMWMEQKAARDSSDDPNAWHPLGDPGGFRYAAGMDTKAGVWRGELAIPWKTIINAGSARPALLRFNFIQHHQATGQSESWAGPIDRSRDDSLTGLLVLKEPSNQIEPAP